MIYKGVIETKLLKLEVYLLELEEWNITNFSSFKKSSMQNRTNRKNWCNRISKVLF